MQGKRKMMDQIIEKVDRELIKKELTPEKLLRHVNKGENEVYVTDAHESPWVMKEIGRLREIAFREAGGGTGKPYDIDEFDTMETPCRQLIVWSPEDEEIIGGYRFILGENIRVENGIPCIATAHMFRFSEEFVENILPLTIELGRSFVATDYQSTRSRNRALFALDNLWDGLGALTVIYPHIKYLFGKVTMYPSYGETNRDLVLGFMHKYFHDNDRLVTPIEELETDAFSHRVQSVFTGSSLKEDYKILHQAIRNNGQNIPPLVNAYMSLSPTMRVFGTAINREFGNVEETGIFFSISEIAEEKKRRHIESYIKSGKSPESLQ